jgi:hypothetical protein
MSRLTVANDQLRIFDDFLPKEAFEPLLEYATSDCFDVIDAGSWYKDGLAWRGPTAYFRDNGAYTRSEDLHYPTGTPVDRLIEAVSNAAGDAETLLGKRGTAWVSMCVARYLHSRGTGLALHRDRSVCTGSFIYYVHREWDPHWGGHLLILDPRTEPVNDAGVPSFYQFLLDDYENQAVSEPGIALCVMPKPNRLVLLKENAYHMVTRVDADAGDRPRISLSGFFYIATKE